MKVLITDHYPLLLEIKDGKIKSCNIEIKSIEYYNYNKLLNIARQIDWLKYKNDKDPNKIVNCLIKEIQYCIENSKYTRHNQRKKKNTSRKDWITKPIINSCNTKEVLYKRFKNNPDNQALKAQYKNENEIQQKN